MSYERPEPNFNPLLSYEGRHKTTSFPTLSALFQSAPLTRGETTYNPLKSANNWVFQSTPLTRGETEAEQAGRIAQLISIHSPHTRGDFPIRSPHASTKISIHSPHTRGDPPGADDGRRQSHFNPLPSCEGRRCSRRAVCTPTQFQSTPLMRGETFCC